MELHSLKTNVTELMHVFAILCLPFFAVLFFIIIISSSTFEGFMLLNGKEVVVSVCF